MLLTQKYRWLRSRCIYAALLALTLTSACSRRVSLNSDGTSTSDSRDLPFHSDANAGGPGEDASHATASDQHDASKLLPFNSSALPVLPAGTLLTVRLENTLTSAKPDPSKTFQAVVEEPITVDDRTVIPRDAQVKGRVESSRVTNPSRRTGYLRLTLDSIRLGDRDIPLPTSSLFARAVLDPANDSAPGTSGDHPVAARPRVIRINKGHLLTFRLTAPLDLSKTTASEDKAQSGTK